MYFFGKQLLPTAAKPTAFELLSATERILGSYIQKKGAFNSERVINPRMDSASLHLIKEEGEEEPVLWAAIQVESIRNSGEGNTFRTTIYKAEEQKTNRFLTVVPNKQALVANAMVIVSRVSDALSLEISPEELLQSAKSFGILQYSTSNANVAQSESPQSGDVVARPKRPPTRVDENDIPTEEEFKTLLSSVGVRQLTPDEAAAQQSEGPPVVRPRRSPSQGKAAGAGLIERQNEHQAKKQAGIDDIIAGFGGDDDEEKAEGADEEISEEDAEAIMAAEAAAEAESGEAEISDEAIEALMKQNEADEAAAGGAPPPPDSAAAETEAPEESAPEEAATDEEEPATEEPPAAEEEPAAEEVAPEPEASTETEAEAQEEEPPAQDLSSEEEPAEPAAEEEPPAAETPAAEEEPPDEDKEAA